MMDCCLSTGSLLCDAYEAASDSCLQAPLRGLLGLERGSFSS